MLGVSLGGLPTVAVNHSSGVHVNSIALTVNGPFNINRAIAVNVVDTAKHGRLNLGGCRSFVRASTTVGPNGSNNTLISTVNGLANVGATVFSGSNNSRNVNFTVPIGLTVRIVGSVVRRNRIVHN